MKPGAQRLQKSFPHSRFQVKIHCQMGRYPEAEDPGGAGGCFLALCVLTASCPCFARYHPGSGRWSSPTRCDHQEHRYSPGASSITMGKSRRKSGAEGVREGRRMDKYVRTLLTRSDPGLSRNRCSRDGVWGGEGRLIQCNER